MSERIDKNVLMAENHMIRTVLPLPIRYVTPEYSGHITEMFGDGIAFVILKDDGEEVYIRGDNKVVVTSRNENKK